MASGSAHCGWGPFLWIVMQDYTEGVHGMTKVIRQREKDPLGVMLLDYYTGQREVGIEVESTTLEMACMTGEVMFRRYDQMDALEKRALECCEGTVLDVGGGSGCHSLWLQEHDMAVDTLDVSPGCIEVMRRRGVHNPLHRNFFSYDGRQYDTILMLMNGLGICGTLERLGALLRQAKKLLTSGGSLIADSTDLTPLLKGKRLSRRDGHYLGETMFVMKYASIVSEPFPWLYADFEMVRAIAGFNGMQCEQLMAFPDGRYLMRIQELPERRESGKRSR